MSDEEKSKVLSLLQHQLETEKQLVKMYEETSPLISSESAAWFLYMLQMDSRKHIAIFELAIDILEGSKIGYPTRQEISVGLEKHMALEEESMKRAKEIMGNRYIKENSGLSRLLETWADDERHHHRTLQRLRDEKFTQVNAIDAYTQYRRAAFQQLSNELKKLVER